MMTFSTEKLKGADVIAILNSRRKEYPSTHVYPFLIGDKRDFSHINNSIEEAIEFNNQSSDDIIQKSLAVDLNQWIANLRQEDDRLDADLIGVWPGEAAGKGDISLHRDILTGNIKPEVFLGTATIQEPWHLPAILKYGGWNDCPDTAVHCAFHRQWQSEFGAQIIGISGDVIECRVSNPPRNQASAVELAWQQYYYCADIVDQGCESINNLASTLLNSPYWYFWWD